MPALSVAANTNIRAHWDYILALQRMAQTIVSSHSKAKLCRTPAHQLASEFFQTPNMVLAGASRIKRSCSTMNQLCTMIEFLSAYRSACPPALQKPRKRRRRKVRFRLPTDDDGGQGCTATTSLNRRTGAKRKRRRRCTPRLMKVSTTSKGAKPAKPAKTSKAAKPAKTSKAAKPAQASTTSKAAKAAKDVKATKAER